jgi:meso-butanediol dehydrogenase / (S,S)-butanediol dehydrogenase / diacetyl reductase
LDQIERLKDKVAIVTGGGAGIGRSICLEFAKEGARVAVVDKNAESAEKTCMEMSRSNSVIIQADVGSELDVERMVASTVNHFGQIDVLCANAGVHSMSPVVDMAVEEWDRIMHVNARGVFLCCKHVARQMIKQGHGGKIVNVSSMSGKTGYGLEAHYSASKFAVIGLTMALADELARYKINVNAVCPGIIDTELQTSLLQREALLKGLLPSVLRQNLIAATPLGRIGTGEDVARLVVFLASPESEFMTGQAINITGGLEKH